MATHVYDVLLSRGSGGGKNAQHCCVYNCQSDSRYPEDPPVWFHHFPHDKNLRKTWLVKIRRDEGPLFKVSKSSVVCSKHFEATDYKWTPVKRMLKSGVVPSKFYWSKEVKKRSGLATNRTPLVTHIPETAVNATDDPMEADADCTDITHDTKLEGDEVSELQDMLKRCTEENAKLHSENHLLRQKLEISRFGINRFSYDDSKIRFYTGFISYQVFIAFFNWIQPTASNMKSMYYLQASENTSLAGRKRNMLLIDELFMFLCRMRLGLLEEDLSDRLDCTVQTVSRKILTWLNYLYFVLGSIPLWLSRQQIDCLMPEDFKPKYSSTRVVLDCTEITCQIPSSMVLNSQAYSIYKDRTTFKSLIGVAPHGAMTFLSPLYTGCMSDNEIVKLSGIRDLLEEGDSVMADKGFRLGKYFAEKNIGLNMPPFLSTSDNGQFTPEQVELNEEIASLRVHVERFNRRVKENHIFDNDVPMSMVGSMNQLWSVACILANFQGPLIAK